MTETAAATSRIEDSPLMRGLHTPPGLFQLTPDHPEGCRCEIGGSELWLSSDTAAKWRAL